MMWLTVQYITISIIYMQFFDLIKPHSHHSQRILLQQLKIPQYCHSGESRNPGGYWMPDQVRHDGVRLFSCQVNMSGALRGMGRSDFPIMGKGFLWMELENLYLILYQISSNHFYMRKIDLC